METQIKFSLGGGKRIRTADPLHAMQVLYQLSYTPEREKALYRAHAKKARGILPKFQNFVKSSELNQLTVFHLYDFKVLNADRRRQTHRIALMRF